MRLPALTQELLPTSAARGHGLGVSILKARTTEVFQRWPNANRFEGQACEDNIAMRKMFLRSGFLQEAHYRERWPVTGGQPLASVVYAILCPDLEMGQTTHFILG
jgi:RimJ/RimL family protein N-acetyltransferase